MEKRWKLFIKSYLLGFIRYPFIAIILGPRYVFDLSGRAMKSDGKMWINPFFYHFYCDSHKKWARLVEASYRSAFFNRSANFKKIKQVARYNTSGIDNEINEICSLFPIHAMGKYLEESRIQGKKTPDFMARLESDDIVFECVSFNDDSNSVKAYESEIERIDREFNNDKDKGAGVFWSEISHNPLGTSDIKKQIKKIISKKGSKQVRDYKYSVLVCSSNIWTVSPDMCDPPTECDTLESGSRVVHTGLLYAAFYGKSFEFINLKAEPCLEFEQEILGTTGRFVGNNSHFNLAIIFFNRKHCSDDPQYIFLHNPNNKMPENLISVLNDKFKPLKILCP